MQKEPTHGEGPEIEGTSPLTISPEKVCFIIIKAREYDAKDAVTETDPGSLLHQGIVRG